MEPNVRQQMFFGRPYVLGPVIGSLGPYAIVEWIEWNGRQYRFDGLLDEETDRVSICGDSLLLPPKMHYRTETRTTEHV